MSTKPAGKLRVSSQLLSQLQARRERPVVHSLEPPSDRKPKPIVGRAYGSTYETPRLNTSRRPTHREGAYDDGDWDPTSGRRGRRQPAPAYDGPLPMDSVSSETVLEASVAAKPQFRRAPSTAVRGGSGSFRERLRLGGAYVNLINDRVDDAAAAEIAQAIRDQVNPAMTTLRLGGNSIGDIGAATLAEAMQSNSTICALHLDNNQIGDSGAAALANALHANNTLTALILSNNPSLGVAAFSALGDALRVNQSLRRLDLDYNPLAGDDGCAALVIGLAESVSLEVLQLDCVRCGDTGALMLASSLQTPTVRLRDLSLDGNSLSEIGVSSLGEALVVNTTLTRLNVSNNPLGDVGAAAMAVALQTNLTLTALSLQNTRLSAVGVRDLATALSINNTLVLLDLSHNAIGDEGASAVVPLIHQLQSLSMSCCQLGDATAVRLSNELVNCETLQYLGVRHNKQISETALDELSSVLSINVSLQRFEGPDGLTLLPLDERSAVRARVLAEQPEQMEQIQPSQVAQVVPKAAIETVGGTFMAPTRAHRESTSSSLLQQHEQQPQSQQQVQVVQVKVKATVASSSSSSGGNGGSKGPSSKLAAPAPDQELQDEIAEELAEYRKFTESQKTADAQKRILAERQQWEDLILKYAAGFTLVKHSKKGSKRVLIKFDQTRDLISWGDESIPFTSVKNLVMGKTTDGFDSTGPDVPDAHCFSLSCSMSSGKVVTIDLECRDKAERQVLTSELRQLLQI